MGQLAGNHFIKLTDSLDSLMDLGNSVPWKGAQDVRFDCQDKKASIGGSNNEPVVSGPYLMEKFLSTGAWGHNEDYS